MQMEIIGQCDISMGHFKAYFKDFWSQCYVLQV